MDAIGTKRGDGESHLPAVSDDPLVDRLHWVIRQSIRLLAALMVVVILWCVADVVLVLCEKLMAPPFLLLDLNDIFVVFAAFLAVLIAIEIFANITLYLREDVIHVKLVIGTALVAIARKSDRARPERARTLLSLSDWGYCHRAGGDLLAGIDADRGVSRCGRADIRCPPDGCSQAPS